MERSKKLQIYPGREKAFEKELNLLKKDPTSGKNKELLTEFHNYLFSKNSGGIRVAKVSSQMRAICRWLRAGVICKKNLDSLDRKDMIALISYIKRLQEKKPATRADYIRAVKQFYYWFRQEDMRYLRGSAEAKALYAYIDDVSAAYPREKIDPSTIINDEDLLLAIEHGARTPKEKAFPDILHETGARIGEFLPLRIGHLTFKETHGEVYIPEGKTGPRTVFISRSVPSLRRYLDVHPHKKNKNSYLWLSESGRNRGDPILHRGAQKLINRVFERAKVEKKHNLHWFRHSRASILAPKMTEAILCKYMGWAVGSKEVRRYVHLCVSQIEDVFLSMHGIKKKDEKPEEPIVCVCGTLNKQNERYCHRCFKPLKMETVIQDKEVVDSEMNKSIRLMMEMGKNPEMMKAFQEFKKNIKPNEVKE